ncbi:MarR family transcriptional regulator [Gracilibacillus salitolerans]|uniref:MarR family transcriptional regulator n=1 Tax=Gracilibacillus salitolerans TaxID=2663022 RepID=A0A5Q2TKN9_9BACI|nr:MarR family transcriptional regulator [Gracilibacillus salitolerans]QGH35509.1 MarR family transcriptional regulator [Gracilibacillus salitolerans]
MKNSELQSSVSYLIVQIAKLHRQEISTRFSKLGIHVGQDMILMALWEKDGITQSEIIRSLNVEPPTITKMINRMEKTGLLERRRDSTDARVSRIFLTEKGRRLKQQVVQSWSDIEEQILQGLTSEERLNLKEQLSYLKRQL